MAQCNLIIDSCCDLPPELVDREDVYLLKFPYLMDEEQSLDDFFQSISAKEFYDRMRKGSTPSTSQLDMQQLQEVFDEVIATGKPSVYLSFSSGLSGSYDIACMMRDQVLAAHPEAELYVVDTHLASVAEGLLVVEALRQHEKGLTAQELVQWAEEARYFINEEFMVDDLEALRRGGRIPGSVAVVGGALDVKPLLVIAPDGTLSLSGVARGRKKGIKALAEFFSRQVQESTLAQTVVIGHSDCPKDAQRLKEQLHKINDNILVIESSIGPVIGSHVGPGMLAVVFWGSDKRENLSLSDRIARKVKKGE